ncbi:MAG: helix-turn-helix transcriptional regulator [Gammaproteobacteria bacterium]|nr:helix-turn-helix transcriptional regulator [Gammaproteobacteria bacterium]MCY4276797.1 helix-turn-helix transcriptional regulator [Gammaproteobacteria bacterium]MCY4322092.1 helix-turn-helix transcriptional regulator [Gammaproteobacteria bacterium]
MSKLFRIICDIYLNRHSVSNVKIYPQQLRRLREEKGWSIARLSEIARVSERQIARIESASEPCRLRQWTHERLREALGEAIDTAPDNNETATCSFHGGALRLQREKRSFTRKRLAEKSGVSVRQIERLEELGESASPRGVTVNRLAKALQVEPAQFSQGPKGETPELSRLWKVSEVGAKVPHQAVIAYDLVFWRYGVSKRALVELAPLLFTLLAEGSLQWRKRLLEDMSDALEKSQNLQDENPHLWFGFKEDRHYWGLEAEEESIERLDILGRHAAQDVGEQYNVKLEDGITPFLNYLRMLVREIGDTGIVDLSNVSDPKGLQWFALGSFHAGCNVCAEEFERLTGGSAPAQLALQAGEVALSEIPEELLSDESTSERVAWLEGRLHPDTRQAWQWLQTNLPDVSHEGELK